MPSLAKNNNATKDNSGESSADPRRWFALILLCTAQFMVVLDFSIVNVALPSIQHDLGFSTQNLQWIISAYSLTFGGFLLLGGRAADLFGRRRLLVAGLVIFVLASLLGGMAQSPLMLIACRAIQGLGAALVAPISLSLIAILFAEGPERNTAMGIGGAVASSGFAAGAILGGLLTATIGWRWVLFVNVPIGIVAIIIAPLLLAETRISSEQRHIDVPGAILVTSGLVTLVYMLAQGNTWGWISLPILGLLALSILLLGAFTFVELRSPAPLVRFSIFRLRNLLGANIIALLGPGAFGALIFILTVFMQDVLHWTPLLTGIGFLPLAAVLIFNANIVSRLITRWGIKPIMVIGLSLMLVGCLLLLSIAPQGTYQQTLLPGLLVLGCGLSCMFPSMIIAATTGVSNDEQGLVSGIINTVQQVGGGLGLALIIVISAVRTTDLAQNGATNAVALTGGFQAALFGCACFTALALLIAIFLINPQPSKAALPPLKPAEDVQDTHPIDFQIVQTEVTTSGSSTN